RNSRASRRGVAMTRRRLAIAATAIACVAWAIGGEWVSIHRGIRENHLVDALAGLSFFIGGLVALERRPSNRIGPLMLAAGGSWFRGNWLNVRWPVWVAPLTIVNYANVAFIAHIALGYPSGRLATRFERVTVGAIYAGTAGAMLGFALTNDPHAAGCVRN